MYREDTIAAVATPPGEGSVAIIRISGVDAETIAGRVFARPSGKTNCLKSHTLHYGKIIDPQSGRSIDDALLTIMRKPRSYTGEDVIEIHCHGGTFVVQQILGLVLRLGARQAEPGEFTKRAFLNGRLDLTQAEAVLDLIRARTEKSASLALDQVGGALSQWVVELREELLDILVQVEAAIDFPEEEIELLRRRDLIGKITGLAGKIHYISETYSWGKLFREGARVCLCGRPNVGKSSLLNALLGEERVIVTPIAGTTRDVIEESMSLDGLPVVLWDTAGIRESNDQIERIGVELSRQHVNKADAVILVLEGSEPLAVDDQALLAQATQRKVVVAINKADLPARLDKDAITQIVPPGHVLMVSAKTGEGIQELKSSLRELLLDVTPDAPVVITNMRHKSALQRSEAALSRSALSLGENIAPEFVAMDLHDARTALEEITGVIQSDDILERIFANFCIGK